MSRFSPAERGISIILSISRSSRAPIFIGTRSSSTSISRGTSAILATCCAGVMAYLRLDQADRLLQNLVFGGDHARVGLIGVLERNQIAELGGDIHRGLLERAADNGSATA